MQADNLYGYIPSLAAGIIFIILFAATTFYHLWQLIQARCRYFIPFVIGGVCMSNPISLFPSDRGRNANVETVQIIGYICRVVARDHLVSIPLYALQSLMILLAPPLYAASVYMVLGRTITYLHAENLSLVPVRWMTKIFVTGDVISFLLQCGGKYLPPHYTSCPRQN